MITELQHLAEQIAAGNAVVYVGAGLSEGAGLPGWPALLREAINWCQKHGIQVQDRDDIEDCIVKGELLLVAEEMREQMGRENFRRFICNSLQTPTMPTAAHTLITELPFCAALTGNYDNILERAYTVASLFPRIYTYNSTPELAAALRDSYFYILKIHGDVNNIESIIIGHKDYSDIIYNNKAYKQHLITLFSTQTFFFVGSSLNEPDLLLLLEEMQSAFRGYLGKHYALINSSGIPMLKLRHFENRYGIKTIPYVPSSPDHPEVIDILKKITQEVNRQQRTAIPKYEKLTAPLDSLAMEVGIWLQALRFQVAKPLIAVDDRTRELRAELSEGMYGQRLLVRCVGGEITTFDVDALVDVLQHDPIEGWLISDKRISADAFAHGDERVKVYRFADFIRNVVWKTYFDALEAEFQSKQINKLSVRLNWHKQKINPDGKVAIQEVDDDLYEYVDGWLHERGQAHISLLGDFGTGKTWFCLNYAIRQKERYLQNPTDERLPFFVRLRGFNKGFNLENFINDIVVSKYKLKFVGSAFDIIDELNRQGKLLFILDGFDEMSHQADREAILDDFWKLAGLVTENSKVILTSRMGYFRWAIESEEILGGRGRKQRQGVAEAPRFETLCIDLFNDEQTHRALEVRSTREKADMLLKTPQLFELLRRPIMSEFVLDAIPEVETGRILDVTQVYLFAVRRKMKRDIGNEVTFTSLADKLYFLCEFSSAMIAHDLPCLHYRQFPDHLKNLFGEAMEDETVMDRWQHDMMNQTLLIRDDNGQYTPAHRSLTEFFAAYKLVAELGVLADEYLELAREQSHLKSDEAPRDYTWSDYFSRQRDERGQVLPITPLRKFRPVKFEAHADFPSSKELTAIPSNALRFAAGMVEKDPAALQKLCEICWSKADRLSWVSQELLPYLRDEHAETLAAMLIEKSEGQPLRPGIPWVLGELGVPSDEVCSALVRTVSAFAAGDKSVDANAWWHSAFALRKLGRVGSDRENDERGPIKFLIDNLPEGSSLPLALERIRDSLRADEYPGSAISEQDVVTVAAHASECDPADFFKTTLSLAKFASDQVRLRCYYVVWLCGYLQISESVGHVVEATHHRLGPIRNCAVNALGLIGVRNSEVVGALEERLQDPYYRVRFHATSSLSRLKAFEAVEALSGAIKQEEIDYVRGKMIEVKNILLEKYNSTTIY